MRRISQASRWPSTSIATPTVRRPSNSSAGTRHAMGPLHVTTPLTDDVAGRLAAGDAVLISGVLYTARDAAHERFDAMLQRGEPLPIDVRGQVIYYCGPTP